MENKALMAFKENKVMLVTMEKKALEGIVEKLVQPVKLERWV